MAKSSSLSAAFVALCGGVKMDKEKEIEDFCLESDACCTLFCTGDDGKKYVEFEDWQLDVNKLQNIIKKLKQEKRQAFKEFAENAVKPIIDELVELLFNDNEPDCKVDCEKGSDIPCGSSICREENKKYWKNKIDDLIKELYGEEKQ